MAPDMLECRSRVLPISDGRARRSKVFIVGASAGLISIKRKSLGNQGHALRAA
jgi:hypothetical protein